MQLIFVKISLKTLISDAASLHCQSVSSSAGTTAEARYTQSVAVNAKTVRLQGDRFMNRLLKKIRDILP